MFNTEHMQFDFVPLQDALLGIITVLSLSEDDMPPEDKLVEIKRLAESAVFPNGREAPPNESSQQRVPVLNPANLISSIRSGKEKA